MVDRTGILPQSPLRYVLASIRFAPWPLIEERINSIHDGLREELPLIHVIETKRATPDGNISLSKAWMILSKDRSYGIQFSQDQVLMIHSNYERFRGFQDTLKNALGQLLQNMRFVDVISMGVRYIDHIKANKDETLDQYIAPKHLTAKISGLTDIGNEGVGYYTSGESRIKLRCVSVPGFPAVPEDVLPILVVLNGPGGLQVENLGLGELILDIDSTKRFASLERMKKEALVEQIKTLHTEANSVFRNRDVCTDHAFQTWRKEE